MKAGLFASLLGVFLICISAPQATGKAAPVVADMILTDARVYTLRWGEPARDGKPAPDAPCTNGTWHPDAAAVAIRGGKIVYVGSEKGALALRGKRTRVIDLNGATVIPGLVDSHTHFIELGAKLESVNLTDVTTEAQAVALVAERAKSVPKGEWIFGAGWDEGAWANRYPDKQLLSAAVPDHPVVLRSLHGFAIWTNQGRARCRQDHQGQLGSDRRRDAAGPGWPTGWPVPEPRGGDGRCGGAARAAGGDRAPCAEGPQSDGQ